jgi:hypothetical protein
MPEQRLRRTRASYDTPADGAERDLTAGSLVRALAEGQIAEAWSALMTHAVCPDPDCLCRCSTCAAARSARRQSAKSLKTQGNA